MVGYVGQLVEDNANHSFIHYVNTYQISVLFQAVCQM